MKKRLVVLFVTALCLLAAVPAKSAWAADPGSRYADAFVLIEQGQAAEEKSDLAAAYRSYQSALSTLHSIRTDAPDWNAQMVEYRLKDCQARFDAVKAKLPEPPPAPAAAELPATSVVTPPVQVPAAVPAPAAMPPAPPPAQSTQITADRSAKLKTQIDKLEAENHQLKSDLTEAKHAARSNSQVDELAKENKDLKAKLATAEKKAAAVKPAPAPVPVDSGEAKRLRTELADAHAEIDRLKKAAATPAPGSSAIIASPPVAAPPADSAEMKKLRAELSKTRAEADAAKKSAAQVPDLEKQNKDLSTKLAAAGKKTAAAAAKPVPVDNSAELKKLHGELDAARADADRSKKASAQVANLEKQNKDLSAQLATAEKKASIPTVDTAELKKLRAEADSARADADKARKSSTDLEKKNAAQLSDLQKQNKDLSDKLAAAEKKTNIVATDSPEVKNLRAELDRSHAEVADLKKQVAAKPGVAPVPVADSSEVKNLRAQLADTHKQLDQANKSANQVSDLQKQNKDLSAKLADADKKASAAAAKPAPVDNSAELKKLHEELDATRAEANKGKKASARVNELEKENKDLSAKLTTEKKEEAEAPTVAPDARVMKELRNENSYLRNLLDTYADQNPELKGQLRRHDQNLSKSSQ
jgi:DNA repair exonuclease SbcCD ATPase subunit